MTGPILELAAAGAAIGAALGHVVRRGVWRVAEVEPPQLRGPWVEVGGAALFAIAGALRAELFAGGLPDGAAGRLIVDGTFLFLLLALGTVDLVYKILPDRLTFGGVAAGLVLAVAFPGSLERGEAFVDHALGAVVGGGVLLALRVVTSRLFGVETMGLGDVKLMAAMGAFLGPRPILAAMLAGMLIGTVLGIVARLVTGKPHFAFGPALGAGGAAILLAGDRIEAGWRAYLVWSQRLGPEFAIGVSVVGLIVCAVLILRVRRRAAEIQREVDADYDELDRRAGTKKPDGEKD